MEIGKALILSARDEEGLTWPTALAAPRQLFPLANSILADGPDPGANPLLGVRACGGRVRVQRVEGLLPCAGDMDALLEGNRRVLEGLVESIGPESLRGCEVQGAIDVHPTARV